MYLVLCWIAAVLFLSLLVFVYIQILHVGGESGGYSNARKDAHDWSENQHQPHHHTLHIQLHRSTEQTSLESRMKMAMTGIPSYPQQ